MLCGLTADKMQVKPALPTTTTTTKELVLSIAVVCKNNLVVLPGQPLGSFWGEIAR